MNESEELTADLLEEFARRLRSGVYSVQNVSVQAETEEVTRDEDLVRNYALTGRSHLNVELIRV